MLREFERFHGDDVVPTTKKRVVEEMLKFIVIP